MTMKKRLSMTGMVEECEETVEAKESMATSGHTCDQTASDDGSQCSGLLVDTNDPPKPASSTRRRSFFGDVDQSIDYENTKTPTSRRRRSIFGSTIPQVHVDVDDDDLDEPKKPSSLRASFFASKTKTTGTAELHDDCPSERSESTCSSRPPTASRRKSLFGSSTPSLDDTIGGTPPRHGKDSSQSVNSESSNSATRRSHHSVEIPPLDKKRGVARAKSMDSPTKKEKSKVSLGGIRSFNGGDSKMRGRKNDHGSVVDTVLLSPTTPKIPLSFRRLSLGALIGGNCSTSDADTVETTKPPKPDTRRNSLTNSVNSPESSDSVKRKEKSSTKTARRCSTGSLKGAETTCVNPFDLVNKARTKRGLHEYTRNMLMDTLAKQVAIELAASNGNRCTPTSYHGNVGQGETIESIHETMLRQKGRTARENLLAPHFFEIGIGMARSKDGLIFLCQLFK